MNFFNKKEIKMISSVLVFISIISFFNFRISIKRARDNQRKNDLGTLQSALEKFNNLTGTFPQNSPDGKIIACKGSDTHYDKKTLTWVNVKPCEWGKDVLEDYSDSESPILMNPLPIDPKNLEGISFLYLSNGKRYQLYAYLESEDDPEFNLAIQSRNLKCGNMICNYGRAFSNTPLDKSLEEYENELLEKEVNAKNQ
jgi:type II secretory pathway pseudopilin PulG